MAQFDYTYQILQYNNNGVPFCTFMYVPEVHPITKREYHEREDDAHVLKVFEHKVHVHMYTCNF